MTESELRALVSSTTPTLRRLLDLAALATGARALAFVSGGAPLVTTGDAALPVVGLGGEAGVHVAGEHTVTVGRLPGGAPASVVAVTAAPLAPALVDGLAAQLLEVLTCHQQYLAEHEERLKTKRQLERADRLATVGKLAAGIAHELGTPLAVVAGRARQLASPSFPADQVSPTARTIAEQADRMTSIIKQLLDFARRRDPRFGRFDVRLLLRQAVTLVEQVAQRRNVKVVLDDMPAARIVQFDGSQMMQVMTNLLMNALQATPTGGEVRVSLGELDREPPADTGLPTGRYVAIGVTDTGSGIAPENLPRVFEPFFTTKDTGEGTGLGLSVTQGIVRDHEGWVAVESTLGQGSTFTVYLPG